MLRRSQPCRDWGQEVRLSWVDPRAQSPQGGNELGELQGLKENFIGCDTEQGRGACRRIREGDGKRINLNPVATGRGLAFTVSKAGSNWRALSIRVTQSDLCVGNITLATVLGMKCRGQSGGNKTSSEAIITEPEEKAGLDQGSVCGGREKETDVKYLPDLMN